MRWPINPSTNRLPPNTADNAAVTVNLADILRNSVEVNRSDKWNNIDVPYSHVMLAIKYASIKKPIEKCKMRDRVRLLLLLKFVI